MANETLTDQQKNWMAKVRQTLNSSTGKSMEEWVEIARTNPETKPRARVQWLKTEHGLGQNYAMMVLHDLAESDGAPLRDTDGFRTTLWREPKALAILEAVEAQVKTFPDLVVGQRKGFTAFSRNFQFAALRPAKGAVRLGLAVDPATDPRLQAASKEGWSERCTATRVLKDAADVDDGVGDLLKAAYERS